jgi:hypothetical protein
MVYWNSGEVGFAAFGGALIAISTSLNLTLLGRVTGLSGMFNAALKQGEGYDFKTVFLVGLLTIPAILNQVYGTDLPF